MQPACKCGSLFFPLSHPLDSFFSAQKNDPFLFLLLQGQCQSLNTVVRCKWCWRESNDADLGTITKSQWIVYGCDFYLRGEQWQSNQERAKASPKISKTIQTTCLQWQKVWVFLNSSVISCVSLKSLRPLSCSGLCFLKRTWCGVMDVDICVHPLSLDPQPPKGFPVRNSTTLVVYMFNRRADIYFQRSFETPLSLTMWGN